MPAKRVVDTATVMHYLGAQVDLRAYAEWGHSIHQDELVLAHEMLARTATLT